MDLAVAIEQDEQNIMISRNRLRMPLTITSTLMGLSFAAGVAITAVCAIRFLFLIAMMGVLGMASVHATTNALNSGDSATRLTVLTQLKQMCDAQPAMAFDVQTAAWMVPAIEQCKTDSDPEVVALAEGLASNIKDNITQTP